MPFARDLFERTESNGWGTADVGGAWSVLSGNADRFSVSDPRAKIITTPSIGTPRIIHLGSTDELDVDAVFLMAGEDTFINDVRMECRHLLRRQSTGEYLQIGLFFDRPAIQIRGHDDTGASLFSNTATGLDYESGDLIWCRVQIEGASPTTIRARAWKDGTSEPGTWHVDETSSTGPQTSGSYGIYGRRADTGSGDLEFLELEATDLSGEPPPPSGVLFFDDFNRADEPIQDSADWDLISGGGTVEVVSEQAEITGLVGGWAGARWSVATDTDDQFVEVEVTDIGGDSGQRNLYVALRMDTGNLGGSGGEVEGYIFAYRWDTGEWRLRKKDGSSFTNLDTLSEAAPSVPFTIRLEAEGNELRGFLNDTEKVSATDSSFNGADHRRVGFLGTFVDQAVDDFAAGDIAEAAEPDVLGADLEDIAFPSWTVSGSKARKLTLTNLGEGSDPSIDITGVNITGADADQFSEDSDPPLTLTPEQSTEIEVTFAPTSVGAKTATLEVTHSGTNSPLEIPLSGTGLAAYSPQTEVSIDGEHFRINGSPTYLGSSIQGALMNSRMVQACFDDENPTTAAEFEYPDTEEWDPQRQVDEFVAALPGYAAKDLLAVTIGLQGGMAGPNHTTPINTGDNITTAFEGNGHIKQPWKNRVEQAIEGCDANGIVVILSLFYQGQSPRLDNEDAVKAAVDDVVDWIDDRGYTNVLIEIANEADHDGFTHDVIQPPRADELIERVQQRTTTGLKASTSWKGGVLPSAEVMDVADYILIHGNSQSAAQVVQMVEDVRDMAAWQSNPRPILFNEDSTNLNKLDAAMVTVDPPSQGWGYYDQGTNNYEDGFQSPPTNWEWDSTAAKTAFFNRVEELAEVLVAAAEFDAELAVEDTAAFDIALLVETAFAVEQATEISEAADVLLESAAPVASGTVVFQGNAVVGARIVVVTADDNDLANAVLHGVFNSDSNGEWESNALPEGKVVFAVAFWNDNGTLHTSIAHGYIPA